MTVVDIGAFDVSANWEAVDENKLTTLMVINRKILKWDRSLLDVTNPFGLILFIPAVLLITVGLSLGFVGEIKYLFIVSLNGAVLFLPHWVTGIRRILKIPTVIQKIEIVDDLVRQNKSLLKDHRIQYDMLLKGSETKLPEDIKLKVNFKDQHPDFLGFYGQVVTNTVNGRTYPYFYTVLVAKKNFGLKEACNRFLALHKITKQYKTEKDVEIIVIRQTTTKTSGYHTRPVDVSRIFMAGLNLAEKVAAKD